MSVPFLSYPTHPLQVSLCSFYHCVLPRGGLESPLKLLKGIISKKRKISFQNPSHLPVASVTSYRMVGLFSWIIVKQVVIMIKFFSFPSIESR